MPHTGIDGPNRFKLGLFCYNVEGGVALTTVPERWSARWDDIVAAVQIADRAGFEFALPVARWRGYGEDNRRGYCFETMTQAAALASITETISLFATIHVPLVHPLMAAKCLATVDHASHGRAGLNIVAGWNQEEFDMFGLSQQAHDGRYEQAREWCQLFRRLTGGGAPFDHEGTFYRGRGMVAEPGTLQSRMPILNAAASPAGRAFAAEFSDYIFTFAGSPAAPDSDVPVLTTCYVVCRPTRREAEEYHQYYAGEMADTVLLDRTLRSKTKQVSHHFESDEAAELQRRLRYAGGNGSHPLIGCPADVAEQLISLASQGFAGATLSFVNFIDELPYFCEEVLPILENAGLRST